MIEKKYSPPTPITLKHKDFGEKYFTSMKKAINFLVATAFYSEETLRRYFWQRYPKIGDFEIVYHTPVVEYCSVMRSVTLRRKNFDEEYFESMVKAAKFLSQVTNYTFSTCKFKLSRRNTKIGNFEVEYF